MFEGTLNDNFYQLLESTNVYSTEKVYTNVLLNMPSIHVYSSEHIYFLVIVVTLMFFLGVCPTALLCIYSIKMFRRKFKNCCSHRIQIVLNTFVETFQGTFKDGLNGTRDYRVFQLCGVVSCVLIIKYMSLRSFSLVKLFTCVVLIPHILMISWAIYKLLCNIRCVRECWFKTSTAAWPAVGREGAWSTAEL